MKPSTLFSVVASLPVALVLAFPSLHLVLPKLYSVAPLQARHRNVERGVWMPVPSGGVRAPCPGTNTLANHGYINRDGKNITSHAYQQAFLDAFGMDFNTTEVGVTTAMEICRIYLGRKRPCTTQFTLDMLDMPHKLEHDASLTRNDKEMAWSQDWDNHTFNQTVWNASLSIMSDSGSTSHINMQVANTVILRRKEQAQVQDWPGWYLDRGLNAYNEAAFYLATMNDPELGQDRIGNPQARKDWVNYWFNNERLPTDLGWVRPSPPIENIKPLATAISLLPSIPAPSATDSPALSSSMYLPAPSATDGPATSSSMSMISSIPVAISASSSTVGGDAVSATTSSDPTQISGSGVGSRILIFAHEH